MTGTTPAGRPDLGEWIELAGHSGCLRRRRLPAQVVAVISNKAEAYGLERARSAGVAAVSRPS